MSIISSIFNVTSSIVNSVNTTTGQPTLQSLQSELSLAGGLSKPNKYAVTINMAPLISGAFTSNYFNTLGVSDLNITKRLLFFCEGAELPGKAITTTDQRLYGPTFKVPYQTTYPDIRLIFNVGADMKEKYFFDAWSNSVENPESHDYNYLYDYITSIRIDQLTEYNLITPIYSVILINAWPNITDMLPLGFDKNDVVHKLGVTFTYKRWLPVGIGINVTDPAASGLSGPVPQIQNVILGGVVPPELTNLF